MYVSEPRSALAERTATSRSPDLSAPTKWAPRQLASVRPEPANSRLLTTVVRTPAALSLANAVGCGCHSCGSTDLFHDNALSSWSVPGILDVKPTTPCAPGVSAVPSEVRLVAVVEGTPAVAGRVPPIRELRNGASSGWSRSSS